MRAGTGRTHSGGMETTTNRPQDTTEQITDSTTDRAADPQGPSYAHTPALVRPVRGRMLTGVAAGVADYFGVDPTIIRIALAVLAVAGPGIPLYLAGWLLIPDEGARQSVAADVIDSFSAR
jgi:phage shock protein PspC (stress-responsive transcriptional regulator)